MALRKVYNAPDAQAAAHQLELFNEKRGENYPSIVKSWGTNWEALSTFFEFPMDIRKIIYTTNLIENVNRIIRKYTKAKSILPNNQAVEKVVYLSLMQVQKNGPCLRELAHYAFTVY